VQTICSFACSSRRPEVAVSALQLGDTSVSGPAAIQTVRG
jgi:hypothetical protein